MHIHSVICTVELSFEYELDQWAPGDLHVRSPFHRGLSSTDRSLPMAHATLQSMAPSGRACDVALAATREWCRSCMGAYLLRKIKRSVITPSIVPVPNVSCNTSKEKQWPFTRGLYSASKGTQRMQKLMVVSNVTTRFKNIAR